MDAFRKWVSFLLALLALTGFVYSYAVILTTDATEPPAFAPFAVTLSGLVGGIVAAAFGQQYDTNTPRKNIMQKAGGYLMPFQAFSKKEIVVGIYSFTYFGISIWAIIVHFFLGSNLDIIENMALVSLGLIFAIINSFLK